MTTTKEQAKIRLEQYAGLRLELHNRIRQLSRLQQADRHRPLLSGSRAAEYAQQIAATVQNNRRELAEVEAAVAALPDPLEREVLQLRYIKPHKDPQAKAEGARHIPWTKISFVMYGAADAAALRRTMRLHNHAITNLSASWQ